MHIGVTGPEGAPTLGGERPQGHLPIGGFRLQDFLAPGAILLVAGENYEAMLAFDGHTVALHLTVQRPAPDRPHIVVGPDVSGRGSAVAQKAHSAVRLRSHQWPRPQPGHRLGVSSRHCGA